MFGFEMSVETAQEFYRRARELGAITDEQRIHLLLEMVKEGSITRVFTGDMTEDQFAETLGEHFKVMDLREKSDDGETKSDVDGGEAGTAGN